MNKLHKKPQPLYDSQMRACCPVCGHVSYSPAGVHPQCAVQAADKRQTARLKAKHAAKSTPRATRPGRYEKQCPKCRMIQHARKQTCVCGYTFQVYQNQVDQEV